MRKEKREKRKKEKKGRKRLPNPFIVIYLYDAVYVAVNIFFFLWRHLSDRYDSGFKKTIRMS